MPVKNINQVATNLDDLQNVICNNDFHPEIRTFGGRHFVNLAKGEDFTLNNIIDCFSKLSLNEPEAKDKISLINNRIRQLDKLGEEELKHSFVLVRIMTWIRHVVGSLFFDRASRLNNIERLLNTPNAQHNPSPTLPVATPPPQQGTVPADNSQSVNINANDEFAQPGINDFSLSPAPEVANAQSSPNQPAPVAHLQETIEDSSTLPIETPPVSSNNDDDNSAVAVRSRSYPPSALFEGNFGGIGVSQFIDAPVYRDEEIIREAEYVYTEMIDEFVEARLTRNGKWVIQQQAKRGCTAGVTAMLIKDHAKTITRVSSDIRKTEEIAGDLKDAGLIPLVMTFEREPDNKMEILRKALQENGSAIVEMDGYIGGHVIIVDAITDQGVDIRDPYHGWAITVTLEAFENSFNLYNMIQVKRPQ